MSAFKFSSGGADHPSSDGWHSHSTGFEKTPHMSERVLDSVLDNIGNTPLVRLNKMAKDAGLEWYVLFL